MSKMKLLVITAHPDDAELMFGGTINKYKREGNRVDILIVTNGENWNRLGVENREEIISMRQSEAKNAAELLKVDSISFLNVIDGLVNSKELIDILITQIRRFNPNMILSHSEMESHFDHKEVITAVKRVCNQFCEPAPIINPFWNCKEEPVSDFKGLFSHHFSDGAKNSQTKYLSLEKEDIDKKIEAILCHKSQFVEEGKIRDKINTEAHFNGIKSGVEYAEVFDFIINHSPQVGKTLLD
jgi:LmbE family N-acetylglucosaminyl deacetylase